MEISNPVLHNSHLVSHHMGASVARMTINGTILKSFILLGLLTCSSFFAWSKFVHNQAAEIQYLLQFSLPLTFLVGWLTYFKPSWSFITSPIYALSQGLLVGGFSATINHFLPGLVSQAIPLTFCVLFSMLLLYAIGLIQVARRLRTIIVTSIVAVFFCYLLEWILAFFDMGIPYVHKSGPLGIIISLVVVTLASFTVLLNVEFIVQSQKKGLPKYMEWYCAYGLMVALIWLYIGIILNLLFKTSMSSSKKK